MALNLKGARATHVAHHLRKGEQRSKNYLALNPQGLVPKRSNLIAIRKALRPLPSEGKRQPTLLSTADGN
jgi:hypothetical protein